MVKLLKEYNPAMHKLTIAIVDFSYTFRLLQSNHHQAVCQEYEVRY